MGIMNLFNPSAREMRRLKSLILEGLGSDPRVLLKLPQPKATTGRALQHCRSMISNVLAKGPHVFKIGVSADPMFRFYKKPTNSSNSCGYFCGDERYKFIHVLFASSRWEEAALMEAVLIEPHQETPGNRNVRPGGDGRQMGEGPFFTYLVLKPV